MAPNIHIISRASMNNSVSKLRVAGANNVIMPDKVGGAHMASLVVMPDVLSFSTTSASKAPTPSTSKKFPSTSCRKVSRRPPLGEFDAATAWASTWSG